MTINAGEGYSNIQHNLNIET